QRACPGGGGGGRGPPGQRRGRALGGGRRGPPGATLPRADDGDHAGQPPAGGAVWDGRRPAGRARAALGAAGRRGGGPDARLRQRRGRRRGRLRHRDPRRRWLRHTRGRRHGRVIQTGRMTRTETARGAAGAVIAGQRIELLDRARIYACGITPYDVTHLGHAATFVWIDTLGRVLRLLGVQPEVCRNVTDVDDVLDAAAGRAGAAYDEFAAIQQFGFDQDMAAIGVRSPEHEPRAHRYVTHVIRLASGLLATGAAYQRAGGVYFRGAGVA